MPQGLQIFNERGKCVFDTNYSTCRVMGTIELKGNDGNFSPNLNQGTKFWCVAYTSSGRATVNLEVTTTGIRWTDYQVYSDDEKVRIIYGCY